MESVNLTDMLDARERRVFQQNNLLHTHQCPLVCLTLNIPGPRKFFNGVPEVFEEGCKRIESLLRQHEVFIKQAEYRKEKTGCEAFYSVDANPVMIKQLMVNLEDMDGLGRLFDIDVLRPDGYQISREELGLPKRTCFLCKEPAHVCSRSRKHSIAELTKWINELIKEVI